MTFAIVKVLPEPVTPTRVEYFEPLFREAHKSSIAFGWSPEGLYLLESLKSFSSIAVSL